MFYVINSTSNDWFGPEEIPDGNLNVANPYPHGPTGAVSLHNNHLANFAMADGHAKALDATSTDPDPVNRPQDNMWDADR
jgi:prepilin-type processing-associated H-X9-DG protein